MSIDRPVTDDERRTRNPRGQGWRLRDDLLLAVSQLLDEGVSPDEMSLRAVARKAGVSPMAPYRHFENFEELLGTTLKMRFGFFAEVIMTGLCFDSPTADQAREQLVIMGHRYVEQGKANLVAYHALFDSSFVVDAEELPGVMLFESVAKLFEIVQTPMDPQVATNIYWCGLHGIVSLSRRAVPIGSSATDERLVSELADSLIGPDARRQLLKPS